MIDKFNLNGTEYITSLIKKAVENESRTATVQGNFIISSAIRIPSNFTLILDNCHLRMADGCYSNLFINAHHDTEIGKSPDGTDHNISIIGKGEAILDGGEYNGLSERTHKQNGLPVWKNNLLLFTNVDGFKISGIHCRNQRWYAMNFIHCANGYIGNIDFCANHTAIDAQGNVYYKLQQDKYEDVLVKNADGIDLRQGCHDITIENISGFTEDDTVALNNINSEMEQTFTVTGLSSDIYNIKIRNVKSAAFCSNVRLLNQGGMKIHDIVIDGVYDTSDESPYLDKGVYAIRIGDTHLYSTCQATKTETYNITIRNVCSKSYYAVALAGDMQGVVMYGIECHNGCKMILDKRAQ